MPYNSYNSEFQNKIFNTFSLFHGGIEDINNDDKKKSVDV